MIKDILDKVYNQKRLNIEDAQKLFLSKDVISIVKAAYIKNKLKNSNKIFYNINKHINPTNICVLNCKFCSFSSNIKDKKAYVRTLDEILSQVRKAINLKAKEIHIVGGLHPRWSLSNYTKIISTIRKSFPKIHIKAYTAVEIDWIAKKSNIDIRNVLEAFVSAGLNSMPGGGAEIFHPDIRKIICSNKISADRWFDIHFQAHRIGLRSNVTMLYGHIEKFEHRVDHINKIRNLQDITGGFQAFIPLAFQPNGNFMNIKYHTMGIDDLKTIAISRLFLDNIDNIKAYWVMLSPGIAQISLKCGANDIDGTAIDENISKKNLFLKEKDILNIIKDSNLIPVERDSLYKTIKIHKKINYNFKKKLSNLDLYEILESEDYEHEKKCYIDFDGKSNKNLKNVIIHLDLSYDEFIEKILFIKDSNQKEIVLIKKNITLYKYLKCIAISRYILGKYFIIKNPIDWKKYTVNDIRFKSFAITVLCGINHIGNMENNDLLDRIKKELDMIGFILNPPNL